MKKLLALFLAALFVFSTATIVFAASPKPLERDENNIVKMDFLDFNPESNALWAKEKDDGSGNWECFISYRSRPSLKTPISQTPHSLSLKMVKFFTLK